MLDFPVDEDLEKVETSTEEALRKMGYEDYKARDESRKPWFGLDYSVNHVQGCWETVIITRDRLYEDLKAE